MTDEHAILRDSAFMQAFLDLVIPPSEDGKLPGAGRVGLASELADALESDERAGPLVEAALRAVHGAALERDPEGFSGLSPELRLEVMESQLMARPALIGGITMHLYLAYYQHPTVLQGLGEPARPPFPEGFEVEKTDVQLLERLSARMRQQRTARSPERVAIRSAWPPLLRRLTARGSPFATMPSLCGLWVPRLGAWITRRRGRTSARPRARVAPSRPPPRAARLPP